MSSRGIAAAPGIVIGRAVVKKETTIQIERKTIAPGQHTGEVERFRECVASADRELLVIQERVRHEMGDEQAGIFEAHRLFLQDPEFVGMVESKILTEGIQAESALDEVKDAYVAIFESMDSEYMQERAADVRDVSLRLMKKLLGLEEQAEIDFAEPIVLAVHDLTPSDTAQLDRKKVGAFVTNIGGRTSHSAIMARSMDIPAVVGLSDITDQVKTGDWVIVDGLSGEVHVRPDDALIKQYEEKQKAYLHEKQTWERLLHEATVTADGHRIELVANIGNHQDAVQAASQGAEGIGLFRTEFLYMGKDHFPTEDEQFEAYKAVADTFGKDRPVIIRTLDIGGDKELSYLSLPKEQNPFLGLRAIRLCLDRVDLFKTQLRALLRASAFGNIKIMYPMIATLKELRQANSVLEEAKAELKRENIPFSDRLETGIMIEVPAAAMIADQLAKEVDFFSIGTNDLIQYTMAADRMNEQVSYLYDPYHPAVLRLIHRVITAAHQEGKWVGMCGEMAGEEHAIPILLALGLDEFSMSASSILRARHLIKQLEQQKLEEIVEPILSLESGEEIKAFVQTTILDRL